MVLALLTVCDSISGLDVNGVTIMDIDQIPPDGLRLTPCLFPEPVNFVTDFVMTRQSTGGGSSAKLDLEYNLHYTFCYAPVGSGRMGLDLYSGMIEKAALFCGQPPKALRESAIEYLVQPTSSEQ